MTPYQNCIIILYILKVGLIIVKYDTIPKLSASDILGVSGLIIVKYDTIPKLYSYFVCKFFRLIIVKYDTIPKQRP